MWHVGRRGNKRRACRAHHEVCSDTYMYVGTSLEQRRIALFARSRSGTSCSLHTIHTLHVSDVHLQYGTRTWMH